MHARARHNRVGRAIALAIDPTQDGCAFHVLGLEALLAQFAANGLQKEAGAIKTERRGDGEWNVFYVVAPDGLCYWFGELKL